LLLTEIAGYTAGEADNVRRAISKKSEKTLLQHREIFAKGAAKKSGLTRQEADAIWDALLGFARYGFNRCLTGDTEILDADSGRLQRIEDLHAGTASIGRAVTCDTDRLTLMPGRVRAVLDNGVKPVYRLTTGLGKQIEATANHPFFTFDGWRLLEQLRPGDRIAAPRRLPVEGRAEWPDYEVIALGHLLAEGNLCHPHSVYFYGQDDVNVADYVRAAEQFDNVECSVAMHKGTYSVYARRIDRSSEPGIVPWAKALGIWGKNARTKEVPAAAFSLTNQQLALLLGRLWSGDGHLGRRPCGAVSAYYATASERLARQVQHLLLRLGVVSRVRQQVFPYKEGRIGFQVHVMGGEQLRNFASALGPHLLRTEHQMICRWLVSEAPQPDKSSRDTIPMAVKELVRAEKDAAGITWLQVNGDSGVAQREFYPAHTATKRGFRREVIGRLAEYFDSDTLRVQAASDIYWDQVVSIEYVGDKRTYDLTIDDTHNFVANDLLVHNSHAADYAVITVQTAYLKAHYPLEYMAAMLYVERDNPEKVAYYITEARRMGIEVLPPDVNASAFNFTVEHAAADTPATRDLHIAYPFPVAPGAAIRYGLAAVKNVGEGPVEAILAGREAGPFPALEALCERVDLRKVGKKALECLIKVGALDAFGERGQLLDAIDQMVGVSRSRHEAEEAGQLSMFDLFGSGLGSGASRFASTLTLPTVEPLTPKQRLEMEKELLGVYVSSHPLQQMAVDLTGVITCTCGELGEVHVGKPVVLAGNVVRVNQISTKKGDRMAFVTLEDLQGQCDVVVFPRTWEETKEIWVQDRIVLVRGKAEKRGESVNVLCDAAQTYVTRALAAGESDPYATLRAAPLFVDGNGHGRPAAASRPQADGAPSRSHGAHTAAEDPGYGDDNGHTSDDDNPFTLEEPEWLREAPAPWEGERELTEKREMGEMVNGERLTVNGELGVARVEPTPAVMPRVDAPTRPSPNPAGTVPNHPVTLSPSHPVTLSSAPREIRVTVQRTPDAERDKRLLSWVVEVLKAKPGPDRFCIVVRKNGAAVQLDFPNDTTTFTPALEQQLVRRLGVGSVEVREEGGR
jgi:DNA polymerase-3 subunit alpha